MGFWKNLFADKPSEQLKYPKPREYEEIKYLQDVTHLDITITTKDLIKYNTIITGTINEYDSNLDLGPTSDIERTKLLESMTEEQYNKIYIVKVHSKNYDPPDVNIGYFKNFRNHPTLSFNISKDLIISINSEDIKELKIKTIVLEKDVQFSYHKINW